MEWHVHFDAAGDAFYTHGATGEAVWRLPLPQGWSSAVDGVGDIFFVHEDGRRQWTHPDGKTRVVTVVEGIDNHHPVAEQAMVPLLTDSPTPVVIAVMNALGSYGTTAVVEDLLPLGQGALRATALKAAAREAIKCIQARGPAAAPGGLSLTGPGAAGQLSLDDHAGAISLNPEEDTQGVD